MSERIAPRDVTFGAVLWATSIQYYVAQFVVGLYWKGQGAFSLSRNTISDLGNTACANYNGRFVCSPLHGVMNVSFVVLGTTMILGSVYIYRTVQHLSTKIGLVLFMLSGIGTMLVGFFPENAPGTMHVIGAGLPFVGGNIALLLFSRERDWPTSLRYLSLLFGTAGLVALPLFLTGASGGLGDGGMERIVAYPQSLWMIVFGTYYVQRNLRR